MTAISAETRKTGIEVVGDMPWGTHFCLFYETKEDLLEILISYCKAGLEGGEFCLWIVAEPLTVEEATGALKDMVPGFSRYLADSSIEIVSARDWYLSGGTFDLKRVTAGWLEKLARASARGYAGVRVTGDTAWLQKRTGNTSVNTRKASTTLSPTNAWRCCARTRLRRAGLWKSWMWCGHTSLPSQNDTETGTSSKPPVSS
jgi:MEDS: MEthanogen/methylotroph, DcmR Sensory domain